MYIHITNCRLIFLEVDIYPVAFFDGVWFKGRSDGKVVKKCVYSVLGVTVEGKKEILGIWISESESASFWTGVHAKSMKKSIKHTIIPHKR